MPFGKKDAARFAKKARGNPKTDSKLKKGGDEGPAMRFGKKVAKKKKG